MKLTLRIVSFLCAIAATVLAVTYFNGNDRVAAATVLLLALHLISRGIAEWINLLTQDDK
ncbi:hypothetical protein EJ419_00735 [Alloscardovia theropitheci]|uniref:Uncharacterized protein n=1 Tax=Alloscardovia theropitheci TaxID=2496842 RepID=A0A4R0QZ01_9BIFI|nr:hypothetical protein [Alloscardovia theropitheci]TCD54951.1 hypothetical protein EJ419_00735 [Alloscardovia theropitheci]